MAPLSEFFDAWPGLLACCRRPLVRRAGTWATLLGVLPALNGGCNYYRTQPQAPETTVLSQLADHKVFVVHEGAQTWQLTSPRLEGEVLVGTLTAGAATQLAYLNPGYYSYRYLHRDAGTALSLVHSYSTGHQAGDNGQARIPLQSMQRLDIVERDTGRTIASHVLSGVGALAAALVLVGIIAALTKSSCPLVYAHDGHQYQFVGEAYSGAVFAPAERHDYLPLPTIAPVAGEYQVKISNELKEREYTNLAELWVVQHAAQVALLEAFCQQLTHDPAYHDWPIVYYYGYHQRRTGCHAAADWFLYVDTDGDLHACPFCQQKSGSALGPDLDAALARVRTRACHAFASASYAFT